MPQWEYGKEIEYHWPGSRRLVDLPAIAISFGSINMHEIEFQKKRDVPRIESVSRIDGQVPAVRST
jgi:hypothetical protein